MVHHCCSSQGRKPRCIHRTIGCRWKSCVQYPGIRNGMEWNKIQEQTDDRQHLAMAKARGRGGPNADHEIRAMGNRWGERGR
eukprot:3532848-Pyramimonas_sp.AAC.1